MTYRFAMNRLVTHQATVLPVTVHGDELEVIDAIHRAAIKRHMGLKQLRDFKYVVVNLVHFANRVTRQFIC
ncbi:hypothetical protein VCR15J2_20019 [Vibrio coralliirubri]|nr:hypothetical protein VCR15J2_20019 [Vibrio coralliirubri]